MTDPQYNSQAQAWDNKMPDESEDGLPIPGICPWCRSPIVQMVWRPFCGCGKWNEEDTEAENRARWLREEEDRMRGEECENEADRRSQRGGW
jgi:hypothetical protein